MSTRRARIKAVASVPTRRKASTVNSNDENSSIQQKPDKTGTPSKGNIETSVTSHSTDSKHITDHSTDTTQVTDHSTEIKQTTPHRTEITQTSNHSTDTTHTTVDSADTTKTLHNNTDSTPTKAHVTDESQTTSAIASSTDSTNAGRPQRRRTMKPTINISSNRKTKTLNKCPKSPQIKHNAESPSYNKPKHQTDEDSITNTDTNSANSATARSLVSIEGIRPLVTHTEGEKRDKAGSAEQTECSFDPILPLPNTNKNRYKLKPMPRLACRRNSLQGSASESEDEARRSRRDESIVSGGGVIRVAPSSNAVTPSAAPAPVTHVLHTDTPAQPQPQPPDTPSSKYPPVRRWRATGGSTEEARRAASRRLAYQNPPHASLTMYDLIFYNPPNNAIRSSPELKESVSLQRLKQEQKVFESQQLKEVEDVVTPTAVPQVKLGANGEIIIDEQSLVVETTEAVQSRHRLQQWPVVVEHGTGGSGGAYRLSRRSKDWSDSETLRFYRALNTLGTDFSLMLSLFPNRTRRELKIKFKKEERQNMCLVDKALKNPVNFDISELEQELAKEKEKEVLDAKQKEENNKLKLQMQNHKRVNYRKSSLSARALEMNEVDEEDDDDDDDDPKSKRRKTKQTSIKTNKSSTQSPTPVPPNVEVGSLVIVADVDEAGNEVMRHFVVRMEDGKRKCCPIKLPESAIKLLATQDISCFKINAH